MDFFFVQVIAVLYCTTVTKINDEKPPTPTVVFCNQPFEIAFIITKNSVQAFA